MIAGNVRINGAERILWNACLVDREGEYDVYEVNIMVVEPTHKAKYEGLIRHRRGESTALFAAVVMSEAARKMYKDEPMIERVGAGDESYKKPEVGSTVRAGTYLGPVGSGTSYSRRRSD